MDRSTCYQIGFAVFSVLAIVCSFLGFKEGRKEQKAKDAETPPWASELQGQLGSIDATDKLLAMHRKLTQQYAAATTAEAVKHFMDTKEDRQTVRSEVEAANQRAVNTAKMRVQPVRDLFLAMVDGWVDELKKRGIKMTVTEQKRDSVVNYQAASNNDWTRQISFSKANIMVYVAPMAIEDGHYARPFQMALQYNPDVGQTDGYQCSVSVEDTAYRVENQKPQRYAFEPFSKSGKDPAEDSDFLNRVREAVDQVMTRLVGLNTD